MRATDETANDAGKAAHNMRLSGNNPQADEMLPLGVGIGAVWTDEDLRASEQATQKTQAEQHIAVRMRRVEVDHVRPHGALQRHEAREAIEPADSSGPGVKMDTLDGFRLAPGRRPGQMH